MKFAIFANFLFVASVAAFPVGEVKDLDITAGVKALQKPSEDHPADDLQTAASVNFGVSDQGLAKGALSWDFRSASTESSSSSSSEEEKEEHIEHFHGGHGGHEHFHGGHGEHEHVHYGGHGEHEHVRYGGHGGHEHVHYGGRALHGHVINGGNGDFGDTTSYWGKPYVAYSGGWWQ